MKVVLGEIGQLEIIPVNVYWKTYTDAGKDEVTTFLSLILREYEL